MISPGSQNAEAGLPQVSEARPLEGLSVGISVSLDEDSPRYGFSAEEEVNRAVLRLSDSLLAAGARLVFGHDWRPTGVMSAVARLAVTYDPPPETTRGDRSKGCRITNLVPWDRKPELPAELRKDLEQRGILRIEQISPEEAPKFFPEVELPNMSKSSKAVFTGVGLIALRRRLAELCDARICMGGKSKNYQGFVPGILEEALESAKKQDRNCVLLSGLIGGAAGMILRASRSNNWEELTRLPLPPDVEKELGEAFVSFLRQTYKEGTAKFLAAPAMIERSGLEPEDWDRLAQARDIEVVIALAIKALRRQAARHRL